MSAIEWKAEILRSGLWRPLMTHSGRSGTRVPGASPAVNGIRASQGNSIVALYLPAASVSLKNASDV